MSEIELAHQARNASTRAKLLVASLLERRAGQLIKAALRLRLDATLHEIEITIELPGGSFRL